MRDRVADVLAQREGLDDGAGAGVVFSLLLHAALGALAVYGALHASVPKAATMVNIQFANIPAAAPTPAARKAAAPKPEAPKLEEPKPRIEEPKPVVQKTPPKPEKNTVPLSPFGRSTRKGSETPAPPPPSPLTTSNPQPVTAEVPVGASGITGLEGGDFPYTVYVQRMHKNIGDRWVRPAITGGASVIIYFRIQRNGTIIDAKVETPSGNGTFDRAALSAVRSASPLAPLPPTYSGIDLGVHLTFR